MHFFLNLCKVNVVSELSTLWNWTLHGSVMCLTWVPSLWCVIPLLNTNCGCGDYYLGVPLLYPFAGLFSVKSHTNWVTCRLIDLRNNLVWLAEDEAVAMFLPIPSQNCHYGLLELWRTSENKSFCLSLSSSSFETQTQMSFGGSSFFWLLDQAKNGVWVLSCVSPLPPVHTRCGLNLFRFCLLLFSVLNWSWLQSPWIMGSYVSFMLFEWQKLHTHCEDVEKGDWNCVEHHWRFPLLVLRRVSFLIVHTGRCGSPISWCTCTVCKVLQSKSMA